ncbi:MAG: endonuclease/exonuclease/phosphatase, partial [Gemmatimonadales bacterium]|nr:endonuclease/exonuclease/phosphatase [Gemmatimonadales bacterium]
MMRSSMAVVFLLFGGVGAGSAQDTLRVMSWNLESGGSAVTTIAAQIQAFDGIDIWGFSEVPSNAKTQYQRGAGLGEGAFFDGVMSQSGGGDRLLIVFDTGRFDLLGSAELDEINSPELHHRSPLVAHFREKATGLEFKFMVNHLARGDNSRRHIQATQLNDWAETQTLPVVAVGDYNFDWDLPNGTSHDQGFDNLLADDVFVWVKPDPVKRTQCSEEDGGCRFNSVLDFVFVAGPAKSWTAESDVVVRAGDFPDNDLTSDHRPVEAMFVTDTAEATTRAQILARIVALEAELAALRALVMRLPP